MASMGQQFASPGRLELTVKCSELPRPLLVQGGLKIGLQTAKYLVTANPPPKIGRPRERAARRSPRWIAAARGSRRREPGPRPQQTAAAGWRVRGRDSRARGGRAARSEDGGISPNS